MKVPCAKKKKFISYITHQYEAVKLRKCNFDSQSNSIDLNFRANFQYELHNKFDGSLKLDDNYCLISFLLHVKLLLGRRLAGHTN